jgi:YidC/Oxa1 family membrane protein insertase
MVLAAVLSAALLVIYQLLFMPVPESPVPPSSGPTTGAPTSGAPTPGTPAPGAPQAPAVAVPAPAERLPVPERKTARPPQRTATIETPLYRAVMSSEGGKLQEWVLHYRGEKALIALGELGPRGLILGRDGEPADAVPLALSQDALRLDAGQEGELVLTGQDAHGILVTETARFKADSYTVDLSIRLENPGPVSQSLRLSLPWIAPAKPAAEGTRTQVQWPTELVWQAPDAVHRQLDLAAIPETQTTGQWVGFNNLYYLSALAPRTDGFRIVIGKEGEGKARIALVNVVTLGPGQIWEGRLQIYAGPKEYDRLKAHDLEGAIDFGGFPLPRAYGGLPMEWLGVPVLWLMHLFYRYVRNYGIAIILLTVITRVIFYPLTVKSMNSMKKMQAIQPQVNALRAKYKNDPQRVQQEMMELYRKQGVNPLGGCLPMVIQIPIFYALYIALSVSVELQNAPFICFGRAPGWVPLIGGTDLWICDLASQDPTYILPIVMGVTMFIQQKMTPISGDPRQAKMMLFMPVIFTFMFLSLPSGLVLYWSVSNALQILQQYLMNREAARKPGREVKDAARA